MNVFDIIADFADCEALEYSIFRDETAQEHESDKGETAQWVVRFPFRDERGEYSAYYHIPADMGGGMASRHRLRKAMTKAIVQARTKRRQQGLRVAA